MHYSKTYAQLLLTLPPELRENAIEYRRLKKLINQVVHELDTLGLNPTVLHDLLQPPSDGGADGPDVDKGKGRATSGTTVDSHSAHPEHEIKHQGLAEGPPESPAKAVYELINDGDHIEPRLRLWVGTTDLTASDVSHGSKTDPTEHLDVAPRASSGQPGQSLLWSLQRRAQTTHTSETELAEDDRNISTNEHLADDKLSNVHHPIGLMRIGQFPESTREIIIPLASDTAFFQLLQTALQTLSAHLLVVRNNFSGSLEGLSRTISQTARPQSSVKSSFRPYSATTDPSAVQSPVISPFSSSLIPRHSDLYAWREIFQLYVEAEVFESLSEHNRGERSVEDSEERLALFAERVTGRGLNSTQKLKPKESRAALESFLQLNLLILNLKKFQRANEEAIRKILKKHTKRTALPLPTLSSNNTSLSALPSQPPSYVDILGLFPSATSSLPHILVQAIGETLLPVIPHIDDYACLICTSIAFKPIRLACRHLFCVRCLVKMQKRGTGDCPMCRAATVLQADRSNVDWALLNFMQDWFPVESKAKLRQNEKEAAKEQMEELGITDNVCIIS